MNRARSLARLADERFDVLVIGGGATGLGTALDATARGYRTALIEAADFASGTSSRSTKLVHGGVRYLQQGNLHLVREALHERERLRRNAPHLVHEQRFVVPAYSWPALAYYGAGLAAYDALAGRTAFMHSRLASSRRARELFPALRDGGLRGALLYSDGAFDDARLAIALARSADERGAALANYVRVTGFIYDGARIAGVHAFERESETPLAIRARVVINAAGSFVDAVRTLDDPHAPPILTHSRGSHLVVAGDALGDPRAALLVPKTSDGRVLFAVPWHGHVVIGTTDVPVDAPVDDPQPTDDEVAYILATVNAYLARPLTRGDVLATFAGLRPLVDRGAASTARQSREHVVLRCPSGLVTIAGGKWTTYRIMARDAVDAAARTASLADVPSPTEELVLRDDPAPELRTLAAADPSLAGPLHPHLPYTGAEVVHAVRAEMARTADDVLARRTRAAFLNEAAAAQARPTVERLIAAYR